MKLIGLFALVCAFCCDSAWAESPQVEFMRSFQSDKMIFPSDSSDYAQRTPGQDPDWMRWFFQELMAWNPTGQPAAYSESCQPSVWAEKFFGKKIQAQTQILNQYLKQCQAEVETGVNQSWIHSLKIMSMKLDLENDPFMHRVVFQLPNGDRVKGRLALKGDLKKRPLVVFRLGVFANIEEFKPERFIFLMLFEQTPFNVLVLENNSGPDSLFFNRRLAVGGFDEGLQNTWIAKLMTDSREPISQIVSSVHMVGMSLGGHGMLYSSLLNEKNLNSKGQKIFSSFFGFCPVVDLQANVNHLVEAGPYGMAVESWSRFRLQNFSKLDPQISDWSVSQWLRLQPTFLKRLIAVAEKDFDPSSVRKLGLRFPPSQKVSKDFWQTENFWSAYNQVRSPVMIWANLTDPLVPFEQNAAKLNEKNIGVVTFSRGFHCTLPIGYDWSALSTFLSAYILSHDGSEFKLKSEELKVEISKSYDLTTQTWFISEIEWLKENPLEINLKLVNRSKQDQLVNSLLPLDKVDFRRRNSQISESEKRMIERWVYQNVKIRTDAQDNALLLQWKRAL